MDLISYVARRLAIIIPTLLGASLVMFVLTMLIPGDPALMRLGNFATAEQLQSLREEMGPISRPYERYVLYLGLLRGDRALMAHRQSGAGRFAGAFAYEPGIGGL